MSSVSHDTAVNRAIEDKITQYYTLKSEYERSIKQKIEARRRGKQPPLRDTLEALRIGQCVLCNSPGMIFSNENGALRSTCVKNSKCEANFVIKKPKYTNFATLIEDYQAKIEKIKEKTIDLKLALLFGYSTEEDTIKEFTKLEAEKADTVMKYDHIREKYHNVVSNTTRDNMLKTTEQRIDEFVKEIKTMLSPAGAVDVEQDVVRTAVQKYCDEMVNLLDLYSATKYSYRDVIPDEDYTDETWHRRLVQNTVSISDIVLPQVQ
jgi:hypothetical protein